MTISSDWPPPERVFDLCIVGSGPAGLTLALEAEARGLSVLLVEAGGPRPDRRGGPVFEEAEILDPERHAPLGTTTRQAFGGTSWLWGGGCVPLDPIDFEVRSFVAGSGWPISYRDLSRWYKKAAAYLDCGDASFSLPVPGWEALRGITVDRSQQLARRACLARAYGDAVKKSDRIWVSLHKAVLTIDLDDSGDRVTGLQVAGGGPVEAAPRARSYVLACGGLRTTQLLLRLQTDWPRHFNGGDGALGRYYMGHLVGEIATIVFDEPRDAIPFLFRRDREGVFNLRHFRVTDERQRSDGILNTVFGLRSPPLLDDRHGSGILSMAVLAARLLPLGAALRSRKLENAASEHMESSTNSHVRNVLTDPMFSSKEVSRLIYNRFLCTPSVPFVPTSRAGRYTLRYHAEQVPNRSSRVQLAEGRDRHGKRGLSIDFKFAEQDGLSVLRAHEILDTSLRTSGKGRLEYWYPPEERLAAVTRSAGDGYHQIGTTRMGESARDAVVDASCRVHGLDNLYIASSSTFPTSGSANPTFATTALALRLADHLARMSGP
jgi:choline dehydrogenase-like flavoprotein